MSWIQVYSGHPFWPLEPKVEDIDILDIAHALSMQCRYAGHTLFHFSISQHSVLVSHAVSPNNALWGLLHDAAEAYLVDIPRPLKHTMPVYIAAEDLLMRCIATKFRLPWPCPDEVKVADTRILGNERRDVLAPSTREWVDIPIPLESCEIQEMTPVQAKSLFLERFFELRANS